MKRKLTSNDLYEIYLQVNQFDTACSGNKSRIYGMLIPGHNTYGMNRIERFHHYKQLFNQSSDLSYDEFSNIMWPKEKTND